MLFSNTKLGRDTLALYSSENKPIKSIGDHAMQTLADIRALSKADIESDIEATRRISGNMDMVDDMVRQPAVGGLHWEDRHEDQVNSPSHYQLWPDVEVIDIIRKQLTQEELIGYYKGNSLKYRLRLGAKDADIQRDLGKAEKYEEWLGDEF